MDIISTDQEKNFRRLEDAVFNKRPVLGEIVKLHGHRSVFDYLDSYLSKATIPVNLERQQNLIEVVKEETALRLGQEVAEAVAKQLEKYYYVSTTDHFGPIYHPWVFNFNLVASAVYQNNTDPVLKNIITLACANVSLNNFSFPRGFSFHSDITGHNINNRFSFLPSNAHSFPVYGFRGFTAQELLKVKNSLKESFNKKQICQKGYDGAGKILDEVYNLPQVLAEKYYADQVTKTNQEIWRRIVPQVNNKRINFVYLEQEWVVVKLLIKYHLNFKTTVSRIIFDDTSEDLLMKYFAGLPESFSRREHLGTYLFWAQPKGNKVQHRLRLWREGNFLVSEDGSYKVELTPDSIQAALETKELIPSVLLTFIVLCFYYGLKCLGGLGQINYLPKLKEAYIKMQTDLGHTESVTACIGAETKDLGGEVTVALVDSKINGTAPATAFDFLIYGNKNSWTTLVEQSKKITFEEAIVPMFPEDYPIVYRLEEREAELSAITPKEITKIMGLDKKLQACVSI